MGQNIAANGAAVTNSGCKNGGVHNGSECAIMQQTDYVGNFVEADSTSVSFGEWAVFDDFYVTIGVALVDGVATEPCLTSSVAGTYVMSTKAGTTYGLYISFNGNIYPNVAVDRPDSTILYDGDFHDVTFRRVGSVGTFYIDNVPAGDSFAVPTDPWYADRLMRVGGLTNYQGGKVNHFDFDGHLTYDFQEAVNTIVVRDVTGGGNSGIVGTSGTLENFWEPVVHDLESNDFWATAGVFQPKYWQDFVDHPNGQDNVYHKFVQDPSCKVLEVGTYPVGYSPDTATQIALHKYWKVGTCGTTPPPSWMTFTLTFTTGGATHLKMALPRNEAADVVGRTSGLTHFAYGEVGGSGYQVFMNQAGGLDYWEFTDNAGHTSQTTASVQTILPPLDGWTQFWSQYDVTFEYGDTTILLAQDSNGDFATDSNGDFAEGE